MTKNPIRPRRRNPGPPDGVARPWPGPITGGGEAFLYVKIGYGPECHLRDVNSMARWACSVCDYEYNEEAGDPAAGIPPGTRFEDLPAGWRCPGCRVGKEAFVRVDEEEEVERNEEDNL